MQRALGFVAGKAFWAWLTPGGWGRVATLPATGLSRLKCQGEAHELGSLFLNEGNSSCLLEHLECNYLGEKKKEAVHSMHVYGCACVHMCSRLTTGL